MIEAERAGMAIRTITFAALLGDPGFGYIRDEYFSECRRDSWNGVHVDTEAYEALERQGMLVVLGVFDGDRMVGFAIVMKAGNLITGQDFCNIDCVYVLPEFRASWGAALLRRALAVGEGAPVLVTAAHGSELARELASDRRSRFVPVETVYQFRRR